MKKINLSEKKNNGTFIETVSLLSDQATAHFFNSVNANCKIAEMQLKCSFCQERKSQKIASIFFTNKLSEFHKDHLKFCSLWCQFDGFGGVGPKTSEVETRRQWESSQSDQITQI